MITSGQRTRLREELIEQFNFLAEMGPYLKQAGRNNEEPEFYEAMFKLWFSYWPEIPVEKEDVELAAHRIEVIKRVCGYTSI